MKIVINKRYGGFSVSEAVYQELGLEWDGYGYLADFGLPGKDEPEYNPDQYRECNSIDVRSDPQLVAAVEKLGEKASGRCASLRVIEVPDDVDVTLEEYDGMEWIAEVHRTWG